MQLNISEATVQAFTQIAIIFLIRDEGFTQEQAVFEVKEVVLNRVGLADLLTSKGEAYLTARRIGATVKANRKRRRQLVMTFENAYNHALFQVQAA